MNPFKSNDHVTVKQFPNSTWLVLRVTKYHVYLFGRSDTFSFEYIGKCHYEHCQLTPRTLDDMPWTSLKVGDVVTAFQPGTWEITAIYKSKAGLDIKIPPVSFTSFQTTAHLKEVNTGITAKCDISWCRKINADTH